MNDSQADSPLTRAELYQATSQQWAHSEQIRWTLLYNYLMASTILLLAWATVYGANVHFRSRPWLLALLSGAGAVVSASWLALGLRASGFVDAYAKSGKSLEGSHSAGAPGPFGRAAAHRESIKGCASLVTSRCIVSGVPGLFTFVYAVLFLLSLKWVFHL